MGVGPNPPTTAAAPGIWNEEQAFAHRRLPSFISETGAVPAAQVQCAGRKSCHERPWEGNGQNGPVSPEAGGWTPVAPSAVPFGGLSTPREATLDDIDEVVAAFANAAQTSHLAGVQAVEIHAGHGYLLHQLLSPLDTQKTDDYGGRWASGRWG